MTRDQWLASAEALLDLDARGALVPHGIGGHARTLLEEARRHLSATVPAGDGELVERLREDAEMLCDGLQLPGLNEAWHNVVMKTAAADCLEAASRLSQAGDSERVKALEHEISVHRGAIRRLLDEKGDLGSTMFAKGVLDREMPALEAGDTL